MYLVLWIMTNDETVAENLLTLQRDFLRDALA